MQSRSSTAAAIASRLRRPLRWLVLVGVVLASPAAASPITYTMEGTFGFVGTGDPLSLNGARLAIVAIADTGVGPVFTSSVSGLSSATYAPQFDVTATFSNRPGGAPDVVLAYASMLQSVNQFPPATVRDAFMFFDAPATFESNSVTMPAFSVFFFGQGYFPGSGTPPLPLFAPADVEIIAAGFLASSHGAYILSNRTFTAVPEPASALGVALGLGLLAVVRRRR